MRTITISAAAALIILLPALSRPDSPITSTPFYEAYADVEIVRNAADSGVLDEEIARYLSSPQNPIDVKAAAVNALGWKFEGKDNAKIYKRYLAQFHGKKERHLKLEDLTVDEMFCLGYLRVMDDYFHPAKGIPLLKEAARRNKNSFTVAIIYALARAQKAMESDFCRVWRVAERVFKNVELGRDMRPEATKIIYDYMVLYDGSCR